LTAILPHHAVRSLPTRPKIFFLSFFFASFFFLSFFYKRKREKRKKGFSERKIFVVCLKERR